jgi:heme exporter protein D
MNWGSAGEFFAMGGYALYVWGSFAATVVALTAEPLLLWRRRQDLIKGLWLEHAAERGEHR